MRTIALAFVLFALPSISEAKEIRGAPPELIGRFGGNRSECQSYHRKSDGITIIDKDFMTSCGGSACGQTIVSHTKTKDGWRLKLAGRSNTFFATYRLTDNDILDETVVISGKAHTKTLARCTERDAVAGIGKPQDFGAITKAPARMFAAFYAIHLPNICPKVTVNTDLANQLIETSKLVYKDFLAHGPNASRATDANMQESAQFEKRGAEAAVRADAEEIVGFCDHVYDAFGAEGTVVKGLITDTRKKA